MKTMMDETLRALIDLQEIDREIYMLRQERASKPEALKALKIELAAIQQRHDEANNEREAHKSRQRLLEGEVALRTTQIEKLSQQLNQVKSNKEYQALLHDIEGVRSDRRYEEEKILETMESIELVDGQLKELDEEIGRKQERLDDEESEINALIAEIDEELSDLEGQRAELAGPVPADALRTYETLLNTTKGQALAAVGVHTCTGCSSHLPLNLINRLHIGESFVTCPSCNRILYERD